MTRTHTKKNAKPQEASFPQKALRTFLWTLGVGAGLILIGSLIASFLPDPAPAATPIGLSVAMLTALIGGIISGKIHRKAPAVCGLTNGALLLAAMLLCSLFFQSLAAGYSTLTAILIHALIPLLSVFGALLGVRRG